MRGGYAVDGTGLGADRRVVALVCVAGAHPVVVAWRDLAGSAWEQGKAAAVTRALVEQALAVGGAGCSKLALADGLDADGPLLAWLRYAPGTDTVVRLPEDRLLYQNLRQLAATDSPDWLPHRYVRVRQGHKEACIVTLVGLGQFDNWDSFRPAAPQRSRCGPA